MDWVASAWVGFDDNSPLGSTETGGRAALPIWLNFMRVAHQGLPAREFEVPPGIVQVRIDPATGLLAGNSVPGPARALPRGHRSPPPRRLRRARWTPSTFFLEDGKRRGL